jgi:hypothetical protein
MIRWILAALLAVLSVTTYSFSVNGSKWPGGTAHMHVGMPGLAASGKSWSDALRRAAQEWTDKTPFKFTLINSYRDPCQGYRASSSATGFPSGTGDEFNGADFSSTVCGNEYGTSVLAVTLVYTESNQLGAFDITEADIVFNSNSRFDIYDGAFDNNRGTDFTRVALHELGHVMGMGHEPSASAIMRPNIGNVFTLQPDDIAGATTLYQGYTRCPVSRLDFGRVTGSLASGDCTVQQLVGGGTDTSLTDVYQLDLAQSTRVTLNMNSATLDSVLVLMSSNSEVIEIDDDGGTGCNSQIVRTLAAGTYAVLANTVTSATGSSNCGSVTGPYQLTARYDSSALIGVSRNTSLQGGSSACDVCRGCDHQWRKLLQQSRYPFATLRCAGPHQHRPGPSRAPGFPGHGGHSGEQPGVHSQSCRGIRSARLADLARACHYQQDSGQLRVRNDSGTGHGLAVRHDRRLGALPDWVWLEQQPQ